MLGGGSIEAARSFYCLVVMFRQESRQSNGAWREHCDWQLKALLDAIDSGSGKEVSNANTLDDLDG